MGLFSKDITREGHCAICKKRTTLKCDDCGFYVCSEHRIHAYDEEEKPFLFTKTKEIWLCDDCFQKERAGIKGTLKRKKSIPEDLKELVKKRAKYKCAYCGAKHPLDIHHKDENPNNNDINNLLCLCSNCHYKIHREYPSHGKKTPSPPKDEEDMWECDYCGKEFPSENACLRHEDDCPEGYQEEVDMY